MPSKVKITKGDAYAATSSGSGARAPYNMDVTDGELLLFGDFAYAVRQMGVAASAIRKAKAQVSGMLTEADRIDVVWEGAQKLDVLLTATLAEVVAAQRTAADAGLAEARRLDAEF